MKHSEHSSYSDEITARCETALLSIWPHLSDVHEHLALVGGLVPRYLCKGAPFESRTDDVDFGISFAADDDLQPHWKLIGLGFRQDEQGRYTKIINGHIPLLVDFLTEGSRGAPKTIGQIQAASFPGVDRAVEMTRNVTIKGVDLEGKQVEAKVRVCEAGPFLCLKLSAYAHRQESKDLFDAMQVIQYYDKGSQAAVEAFRAEANINKAYLIARQVLETHFKSPEDKAPKQYANFCLSAGTSTLPPDEFIFRQTQFANTAVSAGLTLRITGKSQEGDINLS